MKNVAKGGPCGFCGKAGASKRCAGCKKVHYCSRAHQQQHWKTGHKGVCTYKSGGSGISHAAQIKPKQRKRNKRNKRKAKRKPHGQSTGMHTLNDAAADATSNFDVHSDDLRRDNNDDRMSDAIWEIISKSLRSK